MATETTSSKSSAGRKRAHPDQQPPAWANEGDHSIPGANCLLAMKVPSCFPSSTDADILC